MNGRTVWFLPETMTVSTDNICVMPTSYWCAPNWKTSWMVHLLPFLTWLRFATALLRPPTVQQKLQLMLQKQLSVKKRCSRQLLTRELMSLPENWSVKLILSVGECWKVKWTRQKTRWKLLWVWPIMILNILTASYQAMHIIKWAHIPGLVMV